MQSLGSQHDARHLLLCPLQPNAEEHGLPATGLLMQERGRRCSPASWRQTANRDSADQNLGCFEKDAQASGGVQVLRGQSQGDLVLKRNKRDGVQAQEERTAGNDAAAPHTS